MRFTINAYKDILGLDDTYRLKKDDSWMEQLYYVDFDADEDMSFDTFNEAQQWLNDTRAVLINGEKANTIPKDSVNPDTFGYSFEILNHRISQSNNPIPNRKQLQDTLMRGNDRYLNTLVIDNNGIFRLIRSGDKSSAQLQEFPVRYETFLAGNGYVGYKASKDEFFIERTYKTLLEGWWLHTNTGRYIYQDFSSGGYAENKLIDNILTKLETLE